MSDGHTSPPVVDMTDALGEVGDGVHWTLERGGDLNVNLVRLEPGHMVEEHVNREVDVVLIVATGEGSVNIDGASFGLRPHVVADLPAGTARHIEAGPAGLSYFTVHRRRVLGVTTSRRRTLRPEAR
jgi:quercetin dioxygenase-like cupin family protein